MSKEGDMLMRAWNTVLQSIALSVPAGLLTALVYSRFPLECGAGATGARSGGKPGPIPARWAQELRHGVLTLLILAAATALLTAFAPVTASAQTQAVTVNANQDPTQGGYTNSGIALGAGQAVAIKASGLAYYGFDGYLWLSPETDPDGNRYNPSTGQEYSPKYDSSAFLPSAPIGTLLGAIDSNGTISSPFLVGSSDTFYSPANGILLLAYNDDPGQYGNNSGSYSVSISVNGAIPSVRSYAFAEINGSYGPGFVAEPINTATGAHVLSRTLLTVNGAEPLSFRIHYDSLLLNQGPLGRGWGHNFETRLDVISSVDLAVYWDANRWNSFTSSGGNEFASPDPAMEGGILVENADGSYTLTLKDQSTYNFNSSGQLLAQGDGHGRVLDMAYDTDGRLTSVTEPVSGESIDFQYNSQGLIDQVSDPLNRQVQFAYDAYGDLVKITDAQGYATTYTYDDAGRILTGTDPEGRQFFTDTYDAEGRIATQQDGVAGHQAVTLGYDDTSHPGETVTTYTDRDGHTKVFTYDSNFNLLSVVDELGHTTSYTYDADNDMTSKTDALGRQTKYTYDGSGNPTSVTDPAGNSTKMTYDSKNNLLSVTNPAGKTTTYTYDTANNPLTVTDTLGDATTYTYDQNGLMLTKTSPRAGTTTYTYVYGLRRTKTDPAGVLTTYGYDAAGRLTSVADAAGHTRYIAYDGDDNITSVTDPLGNKTSYTYDSHGNLLTATDADGHTTTYAYNGDGKRISKTDPLGNVTTYQYDARERLTGITDADGHTTTMSYDAAGRLTGATDALGETTTSRYDAVGNLLSQTDATGDQIQTVTYDNLDNPLTDADALGDTYTKSYDNLSRLVQSTDPLGRTTTYSYDALNRLVAVTDPAGTTSRQTFDADGNRSSATDPDNNTTTFDYDLADRLTAVLSATGGRVTDTYNNLGELVQITNARGQTATLTYDADGRVTGYTDPDETVSYTYDADGDILSSTDQSGTVTRQYDADNRLISYTDSRGNVIGYAYDPVGNLTTLTYPGGKDVQYQYDAANRLTTVTDWAGRVTTYSYDQDGRLVKTTRPDGSTETRSYDAAGRLTGETDTAADGSVISGDTYGYDADGNVTTEQAANPPQPMAIPGATMTYGPGNRLATYNGQTVSYDADGDMTRGPLNGTMTAFTYNAKGLLTGAGSITYQYDAAGNRIGVTDSVYGTTSYVVDPSGSLSKVLMGTDADGNLTYYVYGLGLIGQEDASGYKVYHFDLRGSTVGLTDLDGKVTDTIGYTPFGLQAYHRGTTSTPFLYAGEYGIMTDPNGLYYMRGRYYDPWTRRFINQDAVFGQLLNPQSLNRYAYVNGNPVSNVDPLGTSWWNTALNWAQDKVNQVEQTAGNVVNNVGQWTSTHQQVIKGALQAAGGVGEVAVGEGLSDTGIGAVIGVPLMVDGASNVLGGGSRIYNFYRGSNQGDTWNVAKQGFAGVGSLIGGQQGRQYGYDAYNGMEFGISVGLFGSAASGWQLIKEVDTVYGLDSLGPAARIYGFKNQLDFIKALTGILKESPDLYNILSGINGAMAAKEAMAAEALK